MPEEIKQSNQVLVVVESAITIVSRRPTDPPRDQHIATLKLQGGGAILPAVWEQATHDGAQERCVHTLLSMVIEQLPQPVLAELAKLCAAAYRGEVAQRILTPQQAAADLSRMSTALLKKS